MKESILDSGSTPFKGHLKESSISPVHEGGGKLFELSENSDKIVRIESFDDIKNRHGETPDPVDVAALGSELYSELQNDYGINVPVNFVAGIGPKGDSVIYGITDKIQGKDLDKIEVSPELTEKVEDLYSKIASYYFGRLKSGKPYLADINNASQYVYGKREGELMDSIYLVDTDLYIRDGKVSFYNIILWLAIHMISVERKYGKKFVVARETLDRLLQEPISQDLSDKDLAIVKGIVVKARDYLAGIMPESDEEEVNPVFGYMHFS